MQKKKEILKINAYLLELIFIHCCPMKINKLRRKLFNLPRFFPFIVLYEQKIKRKGQKYNFFGNFGLGELN
jgi:hypothetical protein